MVRCPSYADRRRDMTPPHQYPGSRKNLSGTLFASLLQSAHQRSISSHLISRAQPCLSLEWRRVPRCVSRHLSHERKGSRILRILLSLSAVVASLRIRGAAVAQKSSNDHFSTKRCRNVSFSASPFLPPYNCIVSIRLLWPGSANLLCGAPAVSCPGRSLWSPISEDG